MNLAGSVIRSRDAALPVLRGHIRSFHMDRREASRADPAGKTPARRRKAPPELQPLIGTGRLCVVKGDFEIRAADAQRHAAGSTLRLETADLQCVICFLADAVLKEGVQRWTFAALFEPSPEQRRWIQSLEKPPRDAERPTAPSNAPQPALRKLPPPPVFQKQHVDSQHAFLSELARDDEGKT